MDYTLKCLELGFGGNTTNCYILKKAGTRNAVVIDPGDQPERINAELAAMDAVPALILLTHGHYDHILALDAVRTDDSTVCHHKDESHRLQYRESIAFWRAPAELWPFKSADILFDGLERSYSLCGYDFEVIHTPGHTEGSVCYRFGDMLFTGDTLFRLCIGRTDFDGGSFSQMADSLRLLHGLEGDFKVYPGHMEPTTLDFERKFNNYMKGAVQQ